MIHVSESAGVTMRYAVEQTGKKLSELYAVILPGVFWVGTEDDFGGIKGSLQDAADSLDVDVDLEEACADLLSTPFNGMLRTLVFIPDMKAKKIETDVLFVSLYGEGAA